MFKFWKEYPVESLYEGELTTMDKINIHVGDKVELSKKRDNREAEDFELYQIDEKIIDRGGDTHLIATNTESSFWKFLSNKWFR